jgi:hypothetical protein
MCIYLYIYLFRFGVNGFPTLRYFKENEPQVVDGTDIERTTENVIAWVKKVHSSPDRVAHLKTVDDLEEYLEKATGVYVIGHFQDEEHAEMFRNVAKE